MVKRRRNKMNNNSGMIAVVIVGLLIFGGGYFLATLGKGLSETCGDTSIILNEVMYNPSSSQGGDSNNEWIEIWNIGCEPIDMEGWTIDGSSVPDPITGWNGGNTVIPVGGYGIIVDQDSVVFSNAVWDVDSNTVKLVVDDNSIGSYGFSNSGDTIKLWDTSGTLVDELIYDDTDSSGCGNEANGKGYSLERVDPLGAGDCSNWRSMELMSNGFPIGGTPGSLNYLGIDNPCSCITDADGDGVLDADDVCPYSTLDNIKLVSKSYAQNNIGSTGAILLEEDFDSSKKLPSDWTCVGDCSVLSIDNKNAVSKPRSLKIDGTDSVYAFEYDFGDNSLTKITVEYDVKVTSDMYSSSALEVLGEIKDPQGTTGYGSLYHGPDNFFFWAWPSHQGVQLSAPINAEWNHVKAIYNLDDLTATIIINGVSQDVLLGNNRGETYIKSIAFWIEESGVNNKPDYIDNVVVTRGSAEETVFENFEVGKNNDQSSYTMDDTDGCTCKQILEMKPGEDVGGLTKGCSKGTIENWINRNGWAKSLGDLTLLVQDDFSDGILNPLIESQLSEYTTLEEVKGELVMTHYQDTPGWIEIEPMFFYNKELTGNFEISIDYNIPSTQYMDNVEIAILTTPYQNGNKVFYVGFDGSGNVALYERFFGQSGGAIGEIVSFPKSGTIKLIRNEGTVIAYLIEGNREILLGISEGSPNPAATGTVYFQPSILVFGNDFVDFEISFDNLIIKTK